MSKNRPVARDIQALVRRNEENFPVGSWLFPPHARREILHFYAFARHADDIADSPTLPAEEKLTQLENLRLAMGSGNARLAPDWAAGYIADLNAGKSSANHGLQLLSAFRQDAQQNRYITYDDLVDYCARSAVPVGRVILELCQEHQANITAADALCTALQILNHLRDVGKDYTELGRIYLPATWLYQQKAKESDLAHRRSSPAWREVYRLCLSECAVLLARAAPLPHSIRSRRLRLELALTLELAFALHHRLQLQDPLASRIRIPVWHWPFYMVRSVRHLW